MNILYTDDNLEVMEEVGRLCQASVLISGWVVSGHVTVNTRTNETPFQRHVETRPQSLYRVNGNATVNPVTCSKEELVS